MNAKGEAFIAAAILLDQKAPPNSEGMTYVTLHLLCQGIEVILKAFLLAHDFDKYYRRLPRKPFAHDLLGIAHEAIAVYGLKPLRGDIATELSNLNDFYRSHRLRYAGLGDLFIGPGSIPRQRVMRRLEVLFRLERKRGRP